MEKKNYYTPEVKFHQLRGNAVMQEFSNPDFDPEKGADEDAGAKGFGSFSFDEDED